MNPFKRKEVVEEPIGPQMVAVFTGRGTPEMCMTTFGWIMGKLKLLGNLKTAEDVALHNVSMEILDEMKARPTVNLLHPEKLTLLIEYERPEDAT